MDYTKGEFLDLLNCSAGGSPGPITCIFDLDPDLDLDPALPADFGGDDDSSINTVLMIDGFHDLKEARILLNKDEGLNAASDPVFGDGKYKQLQKELQQRIFVALLNFTIGRGVCVGDLADPVPGPDPVPPKCITFDEVATRLVIENAISVLTGSDFTVIKKASSGSVSGNSDLLDRL